MTETPEEIQKFFDTQHTYGEYDETLRLEFEDGSMMIFNHAFMRMMGEKHDIVAVKTEHMGNHWFDKTSGLVCVIEEPSFRYSPVQFTREL